MLITENHFHYLIILRYMNRIESFIKIRITYNCQIKYHYRQRTIVFKQLFANSFFSYKLIGFLLFYYRLFCALLLFPHPAIAFAHKCVKGSPIAAL